MSSAIAFRNLADAGSLSASSGAARMPVSLLQNVHVARKWRSLDGAAQFVLCDLGSPQMLDTIGLFGLTLAPGHVARVRVSAVDNTGLAGDLFDSGTLPDAADPAYGALVSLLPAPIAGRFVRIDLDSPSDSVEAGRLFIGQRYAPRINFSFDWSRGFLDRSRRTTGRGGQIFVDRDVRYRTITLSFGALRASERLSWLEEMDRENGASRDLLLITDLASTNLGRDSLWGLVDEVSPVLQPMGWLDGEPIYSKSLTLTERL